MTTTASNWRPTVKEFVFRDVESNGTNVIVVWAKNSEAATQIVNEDHPYCTWELAREQEVGS